MQVDEIFVTIFNLQYESRKVTWHHYSDHLKSKMKEEVIEKVVDDWQGKHLKTLAWLVHPSAISFTTNTAVELHSLLRIPATLKTFYYLRIYYNLVSTIE